MKSTARRWGSPNSESLHPYDRSVGSLTGRWRRPRLAESKTFFSDVMTLIDSCSHT